MSDKEIKPFVQHKDRLKAVYKRDHQAKDAFVYAVRTTGIYCRPTCPSKRPRPENLVLFDTAESAEKAGFRPCKRCRPDQPPEPVVDERIIRACRFIEKSLEAPCLDELAEQAGLSRFYFQRLFKKTLGITPKQYADQVRADRLRRGLTGGNPVTEALYEAGYGSSSRLYEKTDQLLGMAPGNFRGKGSKEMIRYASLETGLGRLMVAGTEKGVCSLEFGDSPEELLSSLKKRFARAEIIPAGDEFVEVLQRIISFLDRPESGLDIPLDIRGTSFQKKVWQMLRNIPVGGTVTYSQLAERLGMPQAPRAVARAVASNHIALAVPCHRVVRKDGGLGGYRWGVERKKDILELEADTDQGI